jgi:3-polyprenyl-4-hydroxybenzoate decarboxylase
VRLLERLRRAGCETHLVATPAGLLNVHHELGLDRKALEALADVSYHPATSARRSPAARSRRGRWWSRRAR